MTEKIHLTAGYFVAGLAVGSLRVRRRSRFESELDRTR